MYCKCKQCTNAQRIFDSLPQKNIVCWNSLISGYSWNGKMVEADELFKKMPERNVASWKTMISGYEENRRFVDVLTSFSVMLASGQIPHGDMALQPALHPDHHGQRVHVQPGVARRLLRRQRGRVRTGQLAGL
jgi:pentatricopeptide repeat protein